MSQFGFLQTATTELRFCFGQRDLYETQDLSEARATCTGEPLHALDRKREESSGAAPPTVPSLVEGTFWIRERLNPDLLCHTVGKKKSHNFNPAFCASCSPRDVQNLL